MAQARRVAALLGIPFYALDVRDNGEGIPRSEYKRIFQKFYRRDDRLSRMTEGSGLGLAIAQRIGELPRRSV